MKKIGFGGGCHWCTEAVFQSLLGVENVEQGWIASFDENDRFSEAVIVHYNEQHIDLTALIEIHLYTHSSRSNHSMREKYRSAVYLFSEEQREESIKAIEKVQTDFEEPIITQVLLFNCFRENIIEQQDYYKKNTGNQFCERHIEPKLQLLMQRYSKHFNPEWRRS
ncbi:peptide-methionine (S)-S-oxide reductase [Chitinophagales bacterium]|nr:peptide-methionine (S)-S-oxide reductase [Chitinophagales bacterium]